MIKLQNIRKTYESDGRQMHALDGVSLEIREGEVYGIIGRSGAGKSTLIRMLNLLERPSAGHVLVDGQDITAFDSLQLRTYRRTVGMVFQHFNLLRSRSIIENVSFPLRLAGLNRAARRQRATEVLELVGLAAHAHKYPSQLSGGQQQRVGIARALASKPRLLLCDEATSALDPETTQSILRLLEQINKTLGLTIVLITHGMDVIRAVCDRVAVLEAGKVVESGQVLDVFLHPRHAATKGLLSESGMYGGEGWRDLAVGISGRMLRLSFRGASTVSPVLSRISRELGLDFSILQGSVGRIKNTPYGQLVVAAQGAPEQLQKLGPILATAGVDFQDLSINGNKPS